MAELDVGKLSLTIEADGSAAIKELDRVRETAEGASTDAARAYQDAGEDMADAFEPVADAAEDTADKVREVGDEAEKTGDSVQTAGTKATKSLKETLKTAEKFGSTMTKAVTAPLLALYTAMVKGASDLTETIGKTEVTFGEFSGEIMDWSEEAVESMGLAQATALDMASTFGDMAVGMDIGQKSAADMSTSLTQLAADLASFKNISADRAAQALTGVFTGETEALKSLGIVMTQTNLQAFALSQGITTQVSAMTQAEQVTLRYQYVMAQTANAQGDFVRTGGNLANQSRALVETLKQAGNAFGELLTPAITEVVSMLREGAESLAQLDDQTKMAILSIGGVTMAVGPLVLAGSKLVGLVTTLKTAMAGISMGPIAIGIAAVTAAVAGLYSVLNRTNTAIDTTSDRYKKFERTLSGGVATKISADTEELDKLDGRNIEVTWEVNQTADSDQVAWDAFYDKIESMGWEAKQFTATGKFEVDPATTEQANAYAEALANAATATSDYDAAVESLNALLDEQLQAQMAQINEQVTEQSKNLVAMYNTGLIDDAEFDRQIETIVTGAKEAKAALEEQAEAAAEANEVFANGLLSDDSKAYGEAAKKLFSSESLGIEDLQGAIETLRQAAEAGEDMTQYTNEAKVVNQQLAEQAIANFDAMTAAQEKYSAAIESSDKKIADAQAEAAQGELLQQMMDNFIMVSKFAPSAEEALQNVSDAYAEQFAGMGMGAEEIAALQQELEALLTTSEGLMSGEEAAAEYGDGGLFAAYQTQMETAIAEAEAARTTAAETFASTLSDLTGDFTAEETQMLLELTASTGEAISEADAAVIAATESMIDEMASAAEGGGAEVTDAVAGMIAGVGDESANARGEGMDVGAAITAGITSGLNNGTGTLYRTVRNIVNKAIATAKDTAEIKSPSRRMRDEFGVMLIRGAVGGIEEETPSAVKTMKRSVENIISGATQVVNQGGYTIPAIESAGAYGIDYDLMGEKLTDAVGNLRMAFYVGDTELAKATRESNAQQSAVRQHEINMGRGRVN